MLSVAAAQLRSISLELTADADTVPGAEGGVVSGQAAVCWPTVAIAERLPAASTAATPSVELVPQLRALNR